MSRRMLAIYSDGGAVRRGIFASRREFVVASVAFHGVVLAAVIVFYHPIAVHFAPTAPSDADFVIVDFPPVEPAQSATGLAGQTARSAMPGGEYSADTLTAGVGDATATVVAEGVAQAPSSPTPMARLPAGFRDSRLYVDPGALRPPEVAASPSDRIVPDAMAALQASEDSVSAEKQRALEARQVEVFGQRITLFGARAPSRLEPLSYPLHHWSRTLPVDAKRWEDLELDRQADAFMRDSVLRERTRAMRAEADRRRANSP